MSKGVNLVLDLGNSATKLLVFDNEKIIFKKVYQIIEVKGIETLVKKYKPVSSIICSVIQTPSLLRTYLKQNTNLLEFNSKTPLSIKMSYKTPETLGQDRIAGIIGASKLFPGKSVLVIDLGTCIKYDFMTAKGNYKGGSISPGLYMRLKSLHDYTDRLPLVQPKSLRSFIGITTQSSILTGVQFGILSEIEGFIARYKKLEPKVKIILTGGDASRFATQLKIPIFAAPDLVGIGLNEILNFNVKN